MKYSNLACSKIENENQFMQACGNDAQGEIASIQPILSPNDLPIPLGLSEFTGMNSASHAILASNRNDSSNQLNSRSKFRLICRILLCLDLLRKKLKPLGKPLTPRDREQLLKPCKPYKYSEYRINDLIRYLESNGENFKMSYGVIPNNFPPPFMHYPSRWEIDSCYIEDLDWERLKNVKIIDVHSYNINLSGTFFPNLESFSFRQIMFCEENMTVNITNIKAPNIKKIKVSGNNLNLKLEGNNVPNLRNLKVFCCQNISMNGRFNFLSQMYLDDKIKNADTLDLIAPCLHKKEKITAEKYAYLQKYKHCYKQTDSLSRAISQMSENRMRQTIQGIDDFQTRAISDRLYTHVKNKVPCHPNDDDFNPSLRDFHTGTNYYMGMSNIPVLLSLETLARTVDDTNYSKGVTYTFDDMQGFSVPKKLLEAIDKATPSHVKKREAIYLYSEAPHPRFIKNSSFNIEQAFLDLIEKQRAHGGITTANTLDIVMLENTEISHSLDQGDTHNVGFNIKFGTIADTGEISVSAILVDSISQELEDKRRRYQDYDYRYNIPIIVSHFLETYLPEGTQFNLEYEVRYSGLQIAGYCTTHAENSSEKTPEKVACREDQVNELIQYIKKLHKVEDLIKKCALLKDLYSPREIEAILKGIAHLVDHINTDIRNIVHHSPAYHHYDAFLPKKNGEMPPITNEVMHYVFTEEKFEQYKNFMAPSIASQVFMGLSKYAEYMKKSEDSKSHIVAVTIEYFKLLQARNALDIYTREVIEQKHSEKCATKKIKSPQDLGQPWESWRHKFIARKVVSKWKEKINLKDKSKHNDL